MPNLGTAYVNIRANLGPLRKGLSMARDAVKRSMQTISRTLKRAAILTAAALTAATVAAAKFQTQLAKVSTMLDQRTMPMMAQFSVQLSELAKSSGQATSALSKGLFDILSASIDAAKAIDVLTVANRAAVGGSTDVATSVDVITGALNAYQLSADKAEEVSDKLFATVKRGKLEYGDLSTVIGTAAATANIAGVSLEELLAVTATATRQNISYSRAAFSITAAINAFLKPQKEAMKIAAKYDLELSSNTLKTIGLAGAIKKLNKATAEELVVLTGGQRGFKAFAATMQDVTGFTHDLNLITNEFAGKASEAYDKMRKRAGFAFGTMVQGAIAMGRALGTPILGPISKLMNRFKGVFGNIEKFFADNSKTIGEWAEFATGKIGEVIDWFDKLFDIAKDQSISAALQTMFDDVTVEIKKVFKTINENIPQMKAALKKAFDAVWPLAEDLGGRIADGFLNRLKQIGDNISESASRGQEKVENLLIGKKYIDKFFDAQLAASEKLNREKFGSTISDFVGAGISGFRTPETKSPETLPFEFHTKINNHIDSLLSPIVGATRTALVGGAAMRISAGIAAPPTLAEVRNMQPLQYPTQPDPRFNIGTTSLKDVVDELKNVNTSVKEASRETAL